MGEVWVQSQGDLVQVPAQPFRSQVTLNKSLPFYNPQSPLLCNGAKTSSDTVDSLRGSNELVRGKCPTWGSPRVDSRERCCLLSPLAVCLGWTIKLCSSSTIWPSFALTSSLCPVRTLSGVPGEQRACLVDNLGLSGPLNPSTMPHVSIRHTLKSALNLRFKG